MFILKIYKIFKWIIIVILVFVGISIAISFIPLSGNYKVFTVQSGSMEPSIKRGSLIFVSPREDYEMGDIITKKIEDSGITVTHRIIQIKEENDQKYFQTQGDANNVSDNKLVSKEMIVGKVFFALPFLGYLTSYAKTVRGVILIIIIPAVVIIYIELNKIRDEIKKKISDRKNLNIYEKKQ